MAAKKKEQGLATVRLKTFRGFVRGNEAFELQASALKKLWMVPALKRVYAESKHPVSGEVTISQVNMENFLICDLIQLEDAAHEVTEDAPVVGLADGVS